MSLFSYYNPNMNVYNTKSEIMKFDYTLRITMGHLAKLDLLALRILNYKSLRNPVVSSFQYIAHPCKYDNSSRDHTIKILKIILRFYVFALIMNHGS